VRKTLSVTGALLLCASAIAAQAEDLVVYQSWSSPGEVKALEVLHAAVAAEGINWIDITIPHNTGSSVGLVNLVAGEQPPNIFSENNANVYRDLTKMGLGMSLDDALAASGALENLSPVVVNAITIDGEIRKMPLGVHIDGMIYYNLEVAAKAGVDPTSWTSLDAMLADFEKIKAAGFVPLSLGAQQWQIGYLTHVLMATVAGPEVYAQVYGSEPNEAALDSAEVRAVFEWLRKFEQAADPGSVNRDWNQATNEVIAGNALMQIQGDWMKGEWRAAGREPGKDFGCIPLPGYKAVAVTVDGWGVLGGQAEATTKAAELFAQVVTRPDVNAAFAAQKGATPVRSDVALDSLDLCAQRVVQLLGDTGKLVNNPSISVDADWSNAVWTVAFNFWSDPTMTIDQAVADLHTEYAAILN
jgi:glucose/mannose transport system substrate-binding protein